MIDGTASTTDPLSRSCLGAPGPMTVLLVDANTSFVTAVRQFLDRLPGVHVVGHALDGPSALAQQRAHGPALVLLDIGLPGMDCLALARAMLRDPAAPQLVFLSMHDNREYRAFARELGADFVDKAEFVDALLPLLSARAQAMVHALARTQARRETPVQERAN